GAGGGGGGGGEGALRGGGGPPRRGGAPHTPPGAGRPRTPGRPPPPPLWFGGWTDAALDRAARLGDGWYGFDQTAEQVADCARRLEKRCAERGRPFSGLKVACGAYAKMPADRGAVAAYAASRVRQFAVSITTLDPAGMVDDLRRLARAFIDR